MRKVTLYTFGEAIDIAKNRSDKRLMVRMRNIRRSIPAINLAETPHIYIASSCVYASPDTIWVRVLDEKTGKWSDSTVSPSREDVLAEDYIDVDEWTFVRDDKEFDQLIQSQRRMKNAAPNDVAESQNEEE